MTPTITIGMPQTAVLEGVTRVTFPLRTPAGPFELCYKVKGSAVVADATAGLAAILLPAMRRGWRIEVEAPVSARVLAGLPQIADIVHCWDEAYAPPEVRAAAGAAVEEPAEPRGVGIFFSGGLDSCYTFFKNLAAIDSLVFVRGFDIPVDDQALGDRVTAAVRGVAESFGRPLVEVETNLRQFTDRHASWDLAHGAALASVGLLLAAGMQTIYIPASDCYADLVPCGSHPLLDPLWSTERLRFVHDGCEARRVRKAALVAEHPAALRALRVCWKNPHGAYNCGRCEKCLRTMVNLYAVGAIDRCPTFDAALDPRRVARLRLGDETGVIAYWKENLSAVRARGSHPALERAIRSALRPAGPLRRLLRSARAARRAAREP